MLGYFKRGIKARKQANKLPAMIWKRLDAAVQTLRDWPAVQNVKALKGEHKGTYRIVIHGYRAQFTVDAEARHIEVIKVGKRGDFYD